MTDFEQVIRIFSDAGVECVIVGGLAATIHGSARLTQDVDFVYARDRANVERLVAALRPHAPYPRGAPPGLPFEWSAATVERGLDFTLTTAVGDVDLLGRSHRRRRLPRASAPQRGRGAVRAPVPLSGPARIDPREARRGAAEGHRGARRTRGASGGARRRIEDHA